MHTRTAAAAAVLLAAGLLATGCSNSSDSPSPKHTGYFSTSPLPATSGAASTPAPTKDIAGLIKACKTAIAAGLDTGAGAPQCNALPRADYLKALHEVDADAQKAFNHDTMTAACQDAIKAQYEPGTAVLTGAPTTPPECAGLSDDEVSQIVLDVIAANTGG